MTNVKKANPGTDEAIRNGCACPVIDNHRGKGRPMADGRVWIYNGNCGYHSAETIEAGRRNGASMPRPPS